LRVTLWPGVPYEYAAVAGDFVFAAGACPIDGDGTVVNAGDLEAQSALAIDNLREAFEMNGADLGDIVKATIYVVARERADLVRAWNVMSPHLDRAPTTLLGVSFLGYPDQLVEIEAIAVVQTPPA
jgi:enamine deaminase RidA (YjgF/YER057c/UK114 family)